MTRYVRTGAIREADGFGYSHRSKRLVEEKLPPDVNLGLLDHRAYYDRFRRSEPYDAEDLVARVIRTEGIVFSA
jgi:hypothetical protein